MSPAWRLSFKSLARNRRRAALTAAAIGVGAAGLLLLFGFILGIEQHLRVTHIYALRTGHLLIYKEGGLERHLVKPETYTFSREEQARLAAALAADPNVERSHFTLVAAGLVSNGCQSFPFRGFGVEPDALRWSLARPELRTVAPRLSEFTRGSGPWASSVEGAVALTDGLAELLRKSRVHEEVASAAPVAFEVLDCKAPDVKERIAGDANIQLLSRTFSGAFAALDAQVVGHLTTGLSDYEEDTVLVPLETLQQMYDTDRATSASVYLRDAGDIGRQAAAWEARLRGAGLRVMVYPWNDAQVSPTYAGTRQFLRVLGGVLLVVMALLVGLSIANSVSMSVLERSRELGTLRAVGFTARRLLGLLIRETLILAGLAGAGGLLAGSLLAFLLSSLGIRFRLPGLASGMLLRIAVMPEVLLLIAATTATVAVLATFVAARRYLRRPILSLLHPE
jgi:putative ABC transport system permease protein